MTRTISDLTVKLTDGAKSASTLGADIQQFNAEDVREAALGSVLRTICTQCSDAPDTLHVRKSMAAMFLALLDNWGLSVVSDGLVAPGFTVRLRSGGPTMTVDEVNDGEAWCAWFNGDQGMCWDTFHVTSLETVQ